MNNNNPYKRIERLENKINKIEALLLQILENGVSEKNRAAIVSYFNDQQLQLKEMQL